MVSLLFSGILDEKLPCSILTKYPSCYSVSLQSLIQDYGATEFSDAFAQYWVKLTQPDLSTWQAENVVNNNYFPFQKVSVYHKVKFYNFDLEWYPGSSDLCDNIHVQSSNKDKYGHKVPGRFDTALVQNSEWTTWLGDIQGKIFLILFHFLV